MKNEINELLAKLTFGSKKDNSTKDIVITLDHINNGTCSTFEKLGYRGYYTALQKQIEHASKQHYDWKEKYKGNADRHVIQAKQNFYKDFKNGHQIWIRSRLPRLWNVDGEATIHGSKQDGGPLDIFQNFYQHGNASFVKDKRGTLVALTFIAILDKLKCKQLRTNRGGMPDKDWEPRVKQYEEMRKWSDIDIADYYLDMINKKIKDTKQFSSWNFEPVKLEMEMYGAYKNCRVYGSNKNESDIKMMFVLYRARHTDCIQELSLEKGSPRKGNCDFLTLSPIERVNAIRSWCIRHNGIRPKRGNTNTPDAQAMAIWLENALRKGGSFQDPYFDILRSFKWFETALHKREKRDGQGFSMPH